MGQACAGVPWALCVEMEFYTDISQGSRCYIEVPKVKAMPRKS